jgi:protein involved in plasmid replication-relaxation
MTVRLTERDRRMFAKCAVCRWLTTDALRRLYFPEATLNAVQKRLRKLAEAGYLRSYREHPTAEAIHALGPKGKPLVEEKGIEVALQTEVPKQIEHLLGINEIRVFVETSGAQIVYFFSWQELRGMGWRHAVIPDAAFAVRATERRRFFVEYDRGTETLEKLVEKLLWYDRGLLDFPFEAVLVITERTRRLDVLSRELGRNGVSVTALASTMEEIREGGFFEVSFVDLLRGARRGILEASSEEEA